MAYKGSRIRLDVNNNVATITFDNENEKVNKFDQGTLLELREVTDVLKGRNDVNGLLVKSAKKFFIVGADINEFGALFQGTEEDLLGWMEKANAIFSDIEDLPYPSLTVINGTALGGAVERKLARLRGTTARG